MSDTCGDRNNDVPGKIQIVVTNMAGEIVMKWITETQKLPADWSMLALSCKIICARRLYMPEIFVKCHSQWTTKLIGSTWHVHTICYQCSSDRVQMSSQINCYTTCLSHTSDICTRVLGTRTQTRHEIADTWCFIFTRIIQMHTLW